MSPRSGPSAGPGPRTGTDQGAVVVAPESAASPTVTAADVDVVIVAHNAGGLLEAAVTSAERQAGAERVWVMDAESEDGSTDAVRGAHPAVHVVPVPNAGFAASNNRGIEMTGGEYVLLLNPDAELADGALATLVATERRLRETVRPGIVAPLVVSPDGSPQADSFGDFPTFAAQARLRVWRVVQRLGGNRALSPKPPSAAAGVDWSTGACMLVRRDAIEAVGPMDEGFFLYYEDVEWCHRMRDASPPWGVVLEPAARAVHHLGGSSAPRSRVEGGYRDSFYRYCDLYGLWGLKAAGRAAVGLRRLLGGAG